ncbi:E3 ubiquitin-protein ligase TRIM39-like [Hyperolius riggenbachi]|uniref:E3 ubiquitin-protein ligase TRIM39-like n=1 Tax=Hyperolius riggenbachi TaxID=752182 RepID=UPI0035A2F59C
MASADLREELNCSICLSLYTEPVSLRCGHYFCRGCLVTVLDTQEETGVYSCPECREEYPQRPLLEKNRKLSNIVESFRSTTTIQEHPEVLCTYCDVPTPAAKSCLLCEASFCDKHLRSHSKSAEHILTEPTVTFEDRKCSLHKEILKYYCTEHSTCICMSCWVAGDHKGHQVELLNEAAEKKKVKLRDVTGKLTSEREETERRIQNLASHRTQEKAKAAAVTGRVTQLFGDIRRKLDDVEKRILTEVTRQEELMSHSVSDLTQQLETQKEEMTRNILQMEYLCNITDPVTVLKEKHNSDLIIPKSGDIISDVRYAGGLDEGIISHMLHRGLVHFADSLTDMKTKRQFQMMKKSDISLDINTAHSYIIISQDLRSATYTDTPQTRPDGPQRFVSCQVISTQSFSWGRHYWEVDVSGGKEWLIGVANHSVERKIEGNESYIGCNHKSWGLTQREELSAVHNDIHNYIDSAGSIKAVGIYLDYEAGRLSFYQLCDPIKHLHTFTATFTEPLHAAFYVFLGSSIRIIESGRGQDRGNTKKFSYPRAQPKRGHTTRSTINTLLLFNKREIRKGDTRL